MSSSLSMHPGPSAPAEDLAAPRLKPPPECGFELPPHDTSRLARYEPLKLVLDVGLALVLSVVCAPVILAFAIAVWMTSPGSPIYTQTRVGRGGRLFRIFKLRTMYRNAEAGGGARWAMPHDHRVTRLGRFLRRTHIDELPQLLNVLRLEMSLVGPRPERPEIVPVLEDEIPNYRARLYVRPGVTGLAQLRLPADTSIADVGRKLTYDLHYIHVIGPWLDFRLVLCTALKVLRIPLRGILEVCRIPDDRSVMLPAGNDPSANGVSSSKPMLDRAAVTKERP